MSLLSIKWQDFLGKKPPKIEIIHCMRRPIAVVTPTIQAAANIIGATNPDIMKGISNGKKELYVEANSDKNIIVELQDICHVLAVYLTFWCFDSRQYTFSLSYSEDGEIWKAAIENRIAMGNDTIFIGAPVKYIKLNGTNTANPFLHLIQFKLA